MKQKLVFFIALALALTQGLAAQEINSGIPLNAGLTENFSAIVGQQDAHTVSLSFNSNEVVRAPKEGSDLSMGLDNQIFTNGYYVSVVGADSQMFSASIVSVSASMTSNVVTMRVNIVYSPTDEGTHQATLKVFSQSDELKKTLSLVGEATVPYTPQKGDADGDGLVTVADVTAIIDYILSGDDSEINLEAADVDDDGNVSVGDISELIDYILGVPDMMLCTFIIISKTNGDTNTYMINENTKINIVDRNLVVKGIRNENGASARIFTCPLENLAQLRYEDRMVTYDKNTLMLLLSNEPTDEYMIEAESQTLNTMQP